MGKVITSDNTIKRLTELERQRCCNRNQFLPTYNDFPTTGEDNVLYIDKEKSKIYLWNGSIYITADDLVGHTNIVATTTYDSLNPLTGWVAPTTPYFGNTATVLFTDDIIVNFTFNGTIWEEKIIDDTAISGIKTANTVYVDGTYGDDTTGQRESRDFPFQTMQAASAVLQSGDTLSINGDISAWTNVIPMLSDIKIESNGVINSVAQPIIGNYVDITSKNIKLDVENIVTTSSILVIKSASINCNINRLTSSASFGNLYKTNGVINIKNLIKTSKGNLIFLDGHEDYLSVDIDNYDFNSDVLSGFDNFIISYEQKTTADVLDKTNGRLNLNINNYTANAYLSGIFGAYDTTSKIISNYRFFINVNNIFQRKWNASVNNYYGLIYVDTINSNYSNNTFTFNFGNVDIDYPVFFRRRGIAGSDYIINIESLKVNYSSLFMTSSSGTGTAILNSNIIYNINKGDVYTLFDFNAAHTSSITLTNSTIVIEGDIKTNTDALPRFILDSTSKIVFKGRFNLGDKKFDLTNVTGAGADNVYFENCTIITSGTNCIDAGVAKNVKILNVRSNKPVNANVTELLSSILVNANIN